MKKQKWSEEKLHLENARKLRGIYFIDLVDKELKKTIKNACKKLETPVVLTVPAKLSGAIRIVGVVRPIIKTKLASFLEASECTRLRVGESLPNHHEDHFAKKGNNSLQHYNLHYNLVRKFVPVPQTVNIPTAKAIVDKFGENFDFFQKKLNSSICDWKNESSFLPCEISQLDLCIFGALPPIQHFSDDRCPLMMQNELGNITSFALSLFEWISDTSIVSNSSKSAISTSPFQIPPRVQSVSEEQSR